MVEERVDDRRREEDWDGGTHSSSSSYGWMTVLFLTLISIPSSLSSDISLPFNLEQSLTRSRFANLNGGLAKTRDIHVFVIKNISEATPIGTVLDTFKAHDKDLPSLNYT